MIEIFLRFFAYALLAHEILYLCRDGREYLTRTFLPVFGLRLSSAAHAAAHVVLMLLCVALLIAPGATFLYPALLIALTVVIAAYSLRLSNHLILAWFMTLILVIAAARDSLSLFVWGVRSLMIGAYVLAFLHKLNRDYFDGSQSAAVQWADFLCFDRGIRSARARSIIRFLHLWGGIVIEGSLPFLLAIAPLQPAGFLLALGFHFAIALLGIVNFSAMMLAGLVVWLPASLVTDMATLLSALDAPWMIAAVVICVAAVWLLTPRLANFRCPYRHRRAAWIFQTTFGVAVAVMACAGIATIGRGLAPMSLDLSQADAVIVACVIALFAVNGLAPYLGLKTEFSFAMFSNLRDEPWRHLLIRDRWRLFRWARYLRLAEVRGLDAARVAADDDCKLPLHLLSSPDRYRYSPYLLRSAISFLHQRTGVEVRPIVIDGEQSLPFREWERTIPRRYRVSMVLFPFVMPLDTNIAHSEQGSLQEREERQLF